MFREARFARRRGAEEGTRPPMQTQIGGVRANRLVSPSAHLIRSEPHPPVITAIPKTIHLDRFAEWRSKFDRECSLLDGIGVGDAALERLFNAVPFGHQRAGRGRRRLAATEGTHQESADENRIPPPAQRRNSSDPIHKLIAFL